MAAKKTNKQKSKGTRKSTMTKKRQSANKSEAIAAPFKKLSVICLTVLLLVWAAGWFILSGGPAMVHNSVSQAILSASAQAGFKVKNVLVEQRQYTDADVLLALVNVREGDPLFSFNPSEAKTQIEKIGWVKSAHIERRLPDTIYIRLIERKPVALWHHDDTLSLVDRDGVVITNDGLERFKDLPMVQGDGAPEKTAALMMVLEKTPQLRDMLDHAEWIDGRRWNLYLQDDRRIKLPEDNVQKAIDHIMMRQKDDQILSKKAIIDIDARYPKRLIVRTRLGTVQDYYKADIHTIGTRL